MTYTNLKNDALSRRKFIKTLGQCGVGAVVATSGLGLSACTDSISIGDSYLRKVGLSSQSAINYWLDVMLQATRDRSLPPPLAARAFAMGHLAGFLAVNGIEGQYNTSYHVGEGPRDANPEVAFGIAFARAFAEGAQTSLLFDKREFLNRYPADEATSRAIAWAEHVSDYVIALRTQDGAQPSQANSYLGRYPRREDVLRWAPTGGFYGTSPGPRVGSFDRGLLPGFGYVKPWIVQSASQFLPKPFPDVRSPEFLAMYERVRQLGGIHSVTRTEKQTKIAYFWEAGGRTITPPGQWQILALQIIQPYNLSLIEQSRLFAMMSLAQADSAIATWHAKYHYDILRPETAIRQRAADLNAMGIAVTRDASWNSLVPTPPFPAYTSGHSAFSTSSAKILQMFLGRDDVKFSSAAMDHVNWPTQLEGVTLSWNSLMDAAHEASISREYGGIHWQTDHDEGLKLGYEIGMWVYNHSFVRRG